MRILLISWIVCDKDVWVFVDVIQNFGKQGAILEQVDVEIVLAKD